MDVVIQNVSESLRGSSKLISELEFLLTENSFRLPRELGEKAKACDSMIQRLRTGDVSIVTERNGRTFISLDILNFMRDAMIIGYHCQPNGPPLTKDILMLCCLSALLALVNMKVTERNAKAIYIAKLVSQVSSDFLSGRPNANPQLDQVLSTLMEFAIEDGTDYFKFVVEHLRFILEIR